MNYYFYDGDDNFFDEVHNCDYIYAFRQGLTLDMVSKLNLAYIGSLEELL